MTPADRARAVVDQLIATGVQTVNNTDVTLRAILATALRAERAAVWAEAATFVDEAEWTELPGDAFPMTRSRFKLALASAVGKIAAALRAKGEAG